MKDRRFSCNRSLEVKETTFWQKYGSFVVVAILGALAGTILVSSLMSPSKKLIDPRGTGEVQQVQVLADEPKCDQDAITYIRCSGERLGMSNTDIRKAIRIAKAESNFNQYAKNPNSTAKGIFQFIDGTWRANCLKDGNVYDFKANIDCFWKVYKVQGAQPWMSSIGGWNE
jgi:hypothetical protein